MDKNTKFFTAAACLKLPHLMASPAMGHLRHVPPRLLLQRSVTALYQCTTPSPCLRHLNLGAFSASILDAEITSPVLFPQVNTAFAGLSLNKKAQLTLGKTRSIRQQLIIIIIIIIIIWLVKRQYVLKKTLVALVMQFWPWRASKVNDFHVI